MAVGAGVAAEGVKAKGGTVRVINAGSGRGLAVLRLQQASNTRNSPAACQSPPTIIDYLSAERLQLS